MRYLLIIFLVLAQSTWAQPREINDHHWENVSRIVAIGDVHGDYDNYIETLRLAGIVNQRGRWIAGDTHLVQTGDIPDRGPDTLRIIRHLSGLARQARRAGGRVHHLIGNHEAMNVYGDLRYVSPGEFEAFVTRHSERTRERYFSNLMEHLRRTDPYRYASLPDDFEEQWKQEHPPGWVEHRQAWDPRWNPNGEMFRWVMASKVAIQLNDLVFLHGGISSEYCSHDLADLTRKTHDALRPESSADLDILFDETGPLWYRGLAGFPPATPPEVVSAILERYDASHIVIGHTPTSGIIWPRHAGAVILIDIGMSAYYGGHIGWLEVKDGRLLAGYPDGVLEIPTDDDERLDYLELVMAMQPDNAHLVRRRDELIRHAESSSGEDPHEKRRPEAEPSTVICGIEQ